MEDNTTLIETLLEKATLYSKSGYELIKLKTLDKATDIISSCVPNGVVVALMATVLFFFNFGIALWIGEILDKLYYGLFAVAVFYCVLAVFIHFFLHKTIKRKVSNYIIKQVLK